MDGVQLTLGVNNIFDKEPPLGSGIDNIDYGPGFWGAYDVYGRYLFSSIQFAF
jgi:outer membrane receptor protein involved in Fe transport